MGEKEKEREMRRQQSIVTSGNDAYQKLKFTGRSSKNSPHTVGDDTSVGQLQLLVALFYCSFTVV